MRKTITTAFLGMFVLTTTGCPSSNTQQSISPAPLPSIAPVVVVTTPPVKPLLVPANPSSAAYLAPGLIQPTNANQRTKQIPKNSRDRDPFTALFLPVPAAPTSAGNNPNNSTQNSQGGSSPTAASRQNNRNQSSSRSSTNGRPRPISVTPTSVAINNPNTAPNQSSSSNRPATSIPNIPLPPNTTLPNNSLEPAFPPALPEPDIAKSVIVMGVIQIGEQTQAIVQVPSEATSRYVQVGQRLSNGQVLVKRIELNAGAEPSVILEQYGVEVSKAVGEQVPSQGQQTPSPTAAVPYPPSRNPSTTTAELPSPPNTLEVNMSQPTLSSKAPVTAR